jgi:hypothetical protein
MANWSGAIKKKKGGSWHTGHEKYNFYTDPTKGKSTVNGKPREAVVVSGKKERENRLSRAVFPNRWSMA